MAINKIRTNDGQEHAINYDALENRPIVEFSWYEPIIGDPMASKETKTIDLKGYLPNDGCNYLVSLQVLTEVNASVGGVTMYASTDIVSNPYSYCLFRHIPHESNTLGGQCQVLVGSGRIIKLYNSGAGSFKYLNAKCVHYVKAS